LRSTRSCDTQGLAITVIHFWLLASAANAAILYPLVRGVLLKPLVNRDDKPPDLHPPSAPGTGDENTTFSVREIQDLRANV